MTRLFYSVFFGFLALGIACITAAFFLNSVPNPFQTLTNTPLQIQSAEIKPVPLEEKIERATQNPIHIVRICQGELPIPKTETATAADATAVALENNSEVDTRLNADVNLNDSKDIAKENELDHSSPELFSAAADSDESATPLSNEHPNSTPKNFKRTYIFLSADEGIPEIITAKVVQANQNAPEVSTLSISDANQPMFEQHGLRAEHGSLNQLKDLDYARQQSRYSDLIDSAKTICFSGENISDQERDKKMDELKSKATAYIQLDLDLDAANSKVSIFYQVNGFIHQQEAMLSDRPI